MNTKTRPTRACFGVQREGKKRGTRRTPKHAQQGHVLVSGTRGRDGDTLDTETRPCGARFGVRDEGKKRGTRRTPKHAQQGRVLVSGTRGRDGEALDTKTRPTRARFGVRDEGKKRGTRQTPKHAHEGVFWCPTRRKGRGRFEHQNAPYKGTFWCLACWERAWLGRERFVGEKGGGEARTARLRLCWVEVSKRKLIKNSGRTLYAHPTPPSVSPGLPMWSIVGGGAFVANEGDGG